MVRQDNSPVSPGHTHPLPNLERYQQVFHSPRLALRARRSAAL
jgi:hypothetical protein